ncbi:3-oxoadipate enol-lactonase 2 [Fusobacterium necrogenes]|uniref:3-oxoadipate enol-lactonase 2 n=1 Tax=Fusobacterium necrogenes TaxID=858 RepID=A0A377GX36_9FUSO|nr:alpha/beta hydrolase [Fusobacterium necrogenes]STO31332.1 3-oxoadipate enol-lactonase 2 [Fusobacterium necrogenes]
MNLRYIDEGEGEVLVFVHSYLWNKEMWRPQIDYLKEKYRCISIDLPGHGESPNLKDIETENVMEKIATFISELLSDLMIEKYTYVGLSIGGMLSVPLYKIDKDKIKKMIVMDSYLGEENIAAKTLYSDILKQVENDGAISIKVAEKIVPMFFSEKVIHLKHELYKKLFVQLINMPRSRINTILKIGKAINERKNLLDELKKIEAPMIFIAGEYDIPRPFSESEEMSKIKKDSLLFKIENAGHISNLENIEKVNLILEQNL